MIVTAAEVVQRASDAAFGRPLVTNSLRGLLVEAMVAAALEPQWHWCGADWGSWDFERSDGRRLELKQSSYRQTWDPPAHGRVSPSFDIRERTGRWEGPSFVQQPGRAAHVYVFAYHDIRDDTADHREPAQWTFYVVPSAVLPETQRISLDAIRGLHRGVSLDALLDAVACRLPPR